MEQLKYTNEGLPVLTYKTISEVVQDWFYGRVTNRDLVKIIEEENPVISKYIGGISLGFERIGAAKEVIEEAIAHHLLLYEALRRQSGKRLPEVKREVFAPLRSDYFGRREITFEELVTQIYTANVEVTNYAGRISEAMIERNIPRNIVREVAWGLLFMYESLRKQADVDRLEKLFNAN